MWSIWLFQFKCLLIINPRKFKLLTQSILFPFIIISGSIIFFCGWWNNLHFYLVTFIDNLLTLNQIDILHNSLFIKLLFIPFFVNEVVSLAKIINRNNLLELWRLFTYIRNNNGPSIEPCGTPVEILWWSELTLSSFWYRAYWISTGLNYKVADAQQITDVSKISEQKIYM